VWKARSEGWTDIRHGIDPGESVIAFTSGRVRDDLGRDRTLLFAA
jgi:hypothetical protein